MYGLLILCTVEKSHRHVPMLDIVFVCIKSVSRLLWVEWENNEDNERVQCCHEMCL